MGMELYRPEFEKELVKILWKFKKDSWQNRHVTANDIRELVFNQSFEANPTFRGKLSIELRAFGRYLFDAWDAKKSPKKKLIDEFEDRIIALFKSDSQTIDTEIP